jgi:hypothetical protein
MIKLQYKLVGYYYTTKYNIINIHSLAIIIIQNDHDISKTSIYFNARSSICNIDDYRLYFD